MSTTKHTRGEPTRAHLLNSAMHTLRAHGLNGFTLELVAAAASVSKGGLLHHFRSKDELIEALLRQLFDDFARRVEAYAATESGTGRWLRAYVRATFEENPMPLELATVLLSAVTNHPKLLGLIREDAAFWQQRLLDDGLPAPRAMVIRQAADAYWSDRLLGTAPTDVTVLASVRDELLRLTEESTL